MLTDVELICPSRVSSIKHHVFFLGAEGCCVVEPSLVLGSNTSSFPLSSEAVPTAQLQTPSIKPCETLYSGLCFSEAQVSEYTAFNTPCTYETRLCDQANRDGRPDSLLWANAAERLSQLMVLERRWHEQTPIYNNMELSLTRSHCAPCTYSSKGESESDREVLRTGVSPPHPAPHWSVDTNNSLPRWARISNCHSPQGTERDRDRETERQTDREVLRSGVLPPHPAAHLYISPPHPAPHWAVDTNNSSPRWARISNCHSPRATVHLAPTAAREIVSERERVKEIAQSGSSSQRTQTSTGGQRHLVNSVLCWDDRVLALYRNGSCSITQ